MKLLIYIIGVMLSALFLVSCGGDDGKSDPVAVENDQDDDTPSTEVNDDYTYTLPVVFHVLYKDAADSMQYVRASRIRELLQHVNELYRGGYYGESQDMKLRFELAEKDENGNKLSTPGVHYVQWPGQYPIDPYTFMSDNTGANVKYIWDPNEYINVMLYNFDAEEGSDGMLLGISHMPYTVKGEHAIAGLDSIEQRTLSKRNLNYAYCSSINSLYVYSQSSRYEQSDRGKNGYYYVSTDVCVTLAHELGHYLGLHHMFCERDGEMANDCADTDYCDDTPSYNRVEYTQFMSDYFETHTGDDVKMSDLVRRNNCEGDQFLSANLMDYAISYGYKFSADQKKRVRHVLYYSPLMPGPRKTESTSRTPAPSHPRTRTPDGPIDLPIRIVK